MSRSAELGFESSGLRGALALALVFTLWFLACYGGASLFTSLHAWRIPVTLALEERLPFLPWTAGVYLSLTPFLLLAPFLFPSFDELLPLFCTLALETALAALLFLALPLESLSTPELQRGLAGGLHRAADLLNLRHNNFPSLHVAFACTACAAYVRRLGRRAAPFLVAWAAAIVLSTVLARQHHLVDVAGGVALAALAWRLVHARASTREFSEAVLVELACLDEFRHFAGRHVRYLVIFAHLYGASLVRWRTARAARVGFCFLQHVDDLLDGDRESPVEPALLARGVLGQLETRRFDATRLGRLARATAAELERLRSAGEDPMQILRTSIEAMLRDRERVLARDLLGRAELAAHHRRTFSSAVDLMLIAARAQLRSRDVPELIEAFGWCSTLRDLREDHAAGRSNVPREVFEEAGLGPRADYSTLVASEPFGRWLRAEQERVEDALARTRERLDRHAGAAGARLLRLFARSIERHARRTRRRFPAHFRTPSEPLPAPAIRP